ncbi:MAG: hypothetical protein LBJ36_07545 [Synergistaceae bacterium]|jgi:hypothetical protein|nr:hypothetical protein [Synergistaceae bacterium]
MTVATIGAITGKRFRFFRKNASTRAFSLVEILFAMLLLTFSASSLWMVRHAFQDDKVFVEKEAQALARWITNRFTLSNRSGRPFGLSCPFDRASDTVKAMWQNPLREEKYNSLYQCQFIRYQGSVVESLYSPQWNTLVPTATLKVSRGRAEHYVIVSQRGRARTSKMPP